MLKTPISFKGPLGQLEQIFDEDKVFKAFKLLDTGPISHWRFNDESQITYATYKSPQGETYQLVMPWPIQASQVGTCQCPEQASCIHLVALALYNKSKLDLLPPFTQQVRALKDITHTFANWLNQQTFDPFPSMARHRMIYILNENGDTGGNRQFTVELYKAYLSQEDKYTVKDKVDSSLLYKKSLPKFVSLLDQQVLYQMNQHGLVKVHRLVVDFDSPELLLSLLRTNRCFWKACYRPPLDLEEVAARPRNTRFELARNVFFIPNENKFIHQTVSDVKQGEIKVSANLNLMPKLLLKTTWQELLWKPEYGERIDWAQISFVTEDHEFNLAEVSSGKVLLDPMSLEMVAGFCFQIEKLQSVHAKYERPVSQAFDINDRFIPASFTAIAPLLLTLKKHDWLVEIDDSYRLNNLRVDQLYVSVEKQTKTKQQGWFDVEVGVKLGEQSINILPYLVKAIKTGQFESVKEDLMIKLDNGQLIDMPKSKVEQIMSTLNELYDEKQLNKDEKLSLNQHQLLRLAEIQHSETDSSAIVLKDIEWLGASALKLKTEQLSAIKTLPETTAPKGLNAELRPYQLTGLAWLRFLHDHDFHGILADDMGLGKTLQVLAHILALKNDALLDAPVLVVAPTSLLGNWQAEIKKFTPQLNSVILTGQHRKQHYDHLHEFQVVITSYGVMSRDYDEINRMVWHSLVLDEAQAIKNRKTQVAKMAKIIPAKHRLCLSGTPLENHLGEIWSLFDFLMPGFLSAEKLFQKFYQSPIEKDQNKEQLLALQNRLAPFILRRTKSEVAKDLPDKTEIVKLIELTESQADVYESIRITMNDEILKAVKNQQNNQILIGNALLRLRQVCCHPSLLKLSSVVGKADSAKLNWLMMVLPNLVEEGRRILIFSSFTSMLQIIADSLDELKIDYYKLTGKTPSHKRTERIDAFQQGNKPVFLISLKAGGAGINLTAADTVIHFDPWWNPAAEQQASDRAHRIGQDKQVFVYKLITNGTVEEKIHHLQKHKQELADNLLNQTSHINEILGKHQWQDLLSPVKE